MSLLRRIEKGGSKGDGEQSQGGGNTNRTPTNRKPTPGGQEGYADLKTRIQNKLLSELDPSLDISRKDEIRRQIQELFNNILAEENIVIAKSERERLFKTIIADILGFGPLEALLSDDTVTEIMVNGPKNVFVERKGRVTLAGVSFDDDDHVMRVIDRIVAPLGRRVDESQPLVDARLPDGSRVNVVIRPIALCGPTITIRKFSKTPYTVQDLINFGSMTAEIAHFLRACVISSLNMVVSGGTGSGKTTLLNVLSSFIPNDERIITVENAAELQLQQEHVVPLESRPANIEGKGAIEIRDLVVNCLRMRPERIVVGECRSGEALDMLQAMNTGHDGSLTTLHANSPRDSVARLEVMCLMAGMDLPTRAIREQIASAVDCIVQQSRLRDGTRKIMEISEVQGMEGEMITMSGIFEFEQTGYEEGRIVGRIRPTGIRPKFIDRIEDAGITLPPTVFGVGRR
ncbi:MAG: CpaF family protein [Anaerolineae bacterium]|nr:CpaF family protein [Anaerolineae bacterium]MCA9888661.1 CpaF family protein [Anaerolineae bacterium]MCA9892022.1 CpaF family protein [Anaerolineae bacterium]MCB9461891.1 CpaF family protein [Anaerolineaceae bacterium]